MGMRVRVLRQACRQCGERARHDQRVTIHEVVDVLVRTELRRRLVHEDIPGIALVAHRDRDQVNRRTALAVLAHDLLGSVGAAVRHDVDVHVPSGLAREHTVEARGDPLLLVVSEDHHAPRCLAAACEIVGARLVLHDAATPAVWNLRLTPVRSTG